MHRRMDWGLAGAVSGRSVETKKEAMAVTWACERFKNCVLGSRITLMTDHKPLVILLSSKPVAELTARLQRMHMCLMCFTFGMLHSFCVPDALLRAPVHMPQVHTQRRIEDEDELLTEMVLQATPFTDSHLQEILLAQDKDENLQALRGEILHGSRKMSKASEQVSVVASRFSRRKGNGRGL
ncbi:hypothetical protein PR048_011730 [Dryococelus australis]|uniref:Reverse transcriptase RNase H-like domain-containing protein n=1 Tax=Dryococelus australis TaxID=614101 RepID=A0ABQ9HMQ3_9NEOP|nr:hypothetical protein PR048_011730 [Dryococelus australis]